MLGFLGLFLVVVIGAVGGLSGFLGSKLIGKDEEERHVGFALGVVFGPVGLIMAHRRSSLTTENLVRQSKQIRNANSSIPSPRL